MSEGEWLITVTDLKHFAYCEVIVYLTHFLGVEESETEYMEYGKEIEKEKFIQQLYPKYKVKEVFRSVALTSKELRLTGVVDYVLITKHNEIIPVEVKWSEPLISGRPKKDHVIQLAAYALLLEKGWTHLRPSVKRGVIYYLKPKGVYVEVAIDYSLKKEIYRTLKKVEDIIKGKKEPKPKAKCGSCNYKPYCPYKGALI
ncbi:MAG: CRISPR-associated protein Cas4 [Zestosphaera tikiterensis]|uniref:CRISPR-associated exonuclease Cas4 n=1 Tax=Zestosphaera tikiterensis TaxID=1973259 RepID=A0A2R7Y0V9_9CREN|nr:MAG: CRISPR-associated protein Cas4 [Zestosphaera tikiterensis]